jgi:hypothetical protein
MFKNNMRAKRTFRFILVNLICAFIFGILYYLVQFVEDNAYFEPSQGMKPGDKQVETISLTKCLHFSLASQTTIGYGGFSPYGPITTLINSLHMVCIFIATAIELL